MKLGNQCVFVLGARVERGKRCFEFVVDSYDLFRRQEVTDDDPTRLVAQQRNFFR